MIQVLEEASISALYESIFIRQRIPQERFKLRLKIIRIISLHWKTIEASNKSATKYHHILVILVGFEVHVGLVLKAARMKRYLTYFYVNGSLVRWQIITILFHLKVPILVENSMLLKKTSLILHPVVIGTV